jgi:ComF family protein
LSDKNLKYRLYRSLWGMLDLLFPPDCGGCGKHGTRWCKECQKKTNILVGIVCDICGLPQGVPGVCNTCLAERPHFRSLRAWSVFDDPIRTALHKLKYRREISLGDSLAAQMVSFVQDLNWPIEAIIPIPLGRRRHKERGYNQVGMVAFPLALALQVDYLSRGLTRRKETRSQVGLTREERRQNVSGAFTADDRVKGKTVLVMDDVSTTGSTLSSSAEALLLSGAKEVYALAIARALPHHGLEQA